MSDPEEEDDWDDEEREREDDRLGCCFPERCLMPGEHYHWECHDLAMHEALELAERTER